MAPPARLEAIPPQLPRVLQLVAFRKFSIAQAFSRDRSRLLSGALRTPWPETTFMKRANMTRSTSQLNEFIGSQRRRECCEGLPLQGKRVLDMSTVMAAPKKEWRHLDKT